MSFSGIFEAYAREDQSDMITELKGQQRHNDFHEIFARTQETAHELEQILLGSIHQVQGMRMLAERYLERMPQGHTHPLTEELGYSKKKNLFHLDDGDEADGFEIEHIGNLTGIGDLENRSPEFWREINMALSLTTPFEITKTLIADSEWVYYTSASQFIYIMPWESYKKRANTATRMHCSRWSSSLEVNHSKTQTETTFGHNPIEINMVLV